MQGSSGPPGGHHSPLSSPLFAGHAAAAAAAAAAHLSGQLHPSPGASHHAHHHQMHHQHPVDLHVPSAAFPYYRYRDDALCWTERKPVGEDMGHPTSVNARILELRKEKSRDAARSRRGKENYEFYELAKMLPLPAAITSQLDKASIIRLTISYLKLRDFSEHGHPPWPSNHCKPGGKGSRPPRSGAGIAVDIFEQHQGTHILQSLDGFAFTLGADGRFLYVSETVSIYLGLSQVEMTGSSVFDYIHHQDHSELAEQLGLGLASAAPGGAGSGSGLASPGGSAGSGGDESVGTQNPDVTTLMSVSTNTNYKGLERAFCIRMKSTLTKRGCHFKSSGYRVVLVLCRLRGQYNLQAHGRGKGPGAVPPTILGMVALAIALPPPSVHEIRLETDMFVTRINFDFRIAHCEPKVSEILDYTSEELTGRNLYTLCHGEDAPKLRKCHVDLINKGQVMSAYYRLMNKSGGYTWLQTCATVVCNSKNNDEQNIICVNYVISGREYGHVVMDCCQLEESRGAPVKRELGGSQDPENGSPDADPCSKGHGRDSGHREGSAGRPPTEERGMNGPEGSRADGGAGDRGGQAQGSARVARTNGKRAGRSKRVRLQGAQTNGTNELTSSDEDDEEESEEECSTDEDEDDEERRRGKRARGSRGRAPQQWSKVDQGPGGPTVTPVFDGAAPVKQLEHAMTKLLPEETTAPPNTDFSTDALLKQRAPSIHWIGNNATSAGNSSGSVLPATALLRQLYASRESVIRSNIQAAPRQSTSFYADSTLATPPSDYDTAAFNGSSAYTPAGFGGGPEFQQTAITPPSSVSPRDGSVAAGGSLTAEAMAAALRTQQYLSQAQSLPLKPQANMAHSVTPSMEHYMEARHQTQLYHHQLAAASFHIYHPAAAAAAAAASLQAHGPLSPNKSTSPPLAYSAKGYHSPWYSAPS